MRVAGTTIREVRGEDTQYLISLFLPNLVNLKLNSQS